MKKWEEPVVLKVDIASTAHYVLDGEIPDGLYVYGDVYSVS